MKMISTIAHPALAVVVAAATLAFNNTSGIGLGGTGVLKVKSRDRIWSGPSP